MTDEVLAKYDVLEATDAPFRLTAPITGITELPDGTLLVHTIVTSETPDSQRGVTRDGVRYDGEIIDYDAFKKAASSLMEWPSLKEMHDQDSAAGTILRLYLDDDVRKAEADLHVVDPVAVKKVLAKVYRAVSLGGVKRATQLVRRGEKVYRRIVELLADEISLVDKPANRDAVFGSAFILAKRDMEAPAVHAPDSRTPQQMAIDVVRGGDIPEALEQLAKNGGGGADDQDGAADRADQPAAAAAEAPDADAGADNGATDQGEEDEAMAKGDGETELEAVPAAAVVDEALPEVATDPDAVILEEHSDDAAIAKGATPAAGEIVAGLEPLRKYANAVVDALQSALSSVTYAISCEAAEGDAGDVDALRDIANALQAALISEASEPPSPPTLAEAIEAVEEAVDAVVDEAPEVLAVSYGRVRLSRAQADLELAAAEFRKAGRRNSNADQARLDAIHELTVEMGTSAHPAAAAAPEPEMPGEPFAKSAAGADAFIDQVRAVLAEVLPSGKLEAIEQQLAAANAKATAQGETLERIAKAEAGGGPMARFSRIYEAAERGGGVGRQEADPASVLEAAAELVDDPRLKQELGSRAALRQIGAARAGAAG